MSDPTRADCNDHEGVSSEANTKPLREVWICNGASRFDDGVCHGTAFYKEGKPPPVKCCVCGAHDWILMREVPGQSSHKATPRIVWEAGSFATKELAEAYIHELLNKLRKRDATKQLVHKLKLTFEQLYVAIQTDDGNWRIAATQEHVAAVEARDE